MFDTFDPVKIQVISSVITSIVAMLSIAIAVAAMLQTKKITEESNRPYVAVYLEATQVTSTVVNFIVIKNFGNTGALIDSISYSPPFNNEFGGSSFSSFKNHFIAPNQSITSACKFLEPYEPITFNVKYHNGKKKFEDFFVINPSAVASITYSKVTPSNASSLEKIISFSAQEIIRTRL